MKKLLFIVFQPINPNDGISKKILSQVDAFTYNGVETHIMNYAFNEHGEKSFLLDNSFFFRFGRGINNYLCRNRLFGLIFRYIEKNKIDSIYIRYIQNADFFFDRFLKKCNNHNISVYLEIPTYPYDGEYKKTSFMTWIKVSQEHYFRRRFHKFITKIITFSEDDCIFGVETLKLSNAVDESKIPLKINKSKGDDKIIMLGVAYLSFWHGYDRLIRGIYNYYKQCSKDLKNIEFWIVGRGDERVYNELASLVKELNLENHVKMLGTKGGEELDYLFNKADVAIGCLACHRKGIYEVKSLKNVEYAMRGCPFIYSENNNDFDDMPYIKKFPANENAIDIDEILLFLNQITLEPSQIRDSVKHLTWKEQIKKITK